MPEYHCDEVKLQEFIQSLWVELMYLLVNNPNLSVQAAMKSVLSRWRIEEPSATLTLIVDLFLPGQALQTQEGVWGEPTIHIDTRALKRTTQQELLDAEKLFKPLGLRGFPGSFFDTLFESDLGINLGQFKKLDELMRDPRRTKEEMVFYDSDTAEEWIRRP